MMRTAIVSSVIFAIAHSVTADEPVSFNRDVRSILAEHCWQCHGPDKHSRKAGLRLDTRGEALLPAESGNIAIVPHDPDRSELLHRITASDAAIRMPPSELNKPLSHAQVAILRRWIAAGAEFQKHWAFEPPLKANVPHAEGITNPIDAFVAARLAERGKDFSPEAARESLLRRVSIDLTGLPPSLEELDDTDETYEAAVDRLLSSPHFGERMAVDWLDSARYADTNGYFGDKPRLMWLWRDWVINAFNSNMPFDQFTIEQIAGDLLPEATVSQRIATGFNRNHVANNETGIIDEEFRTEYVVDRVDTTMTTWMGLTAGCAQCHDHKYDPISQREFYQLFAFFNNVPETGLIVSDNPPPLITVTTPEQEQHLTRLAAETAKAVQVFEPLRVQMTDEMSAWASVAMQTLPCPPNDGLLLHETFSGQLSESTIHVGTPLKFQSGIRGQGIRLDATRHAERTLSDFDADGAWSIGLWMLPDGSLSSPLSKIEPKGNRRGIEMIWQKGRVSVNLVERWGVNAVEVSAKTPAGKGQWHHVVICYDGSGTAQGLKVFIDGVATAVDVHRDSLTGSISNAQPLLIGRRDSGLGFYGILDELRIVQGALGDQDVADWFRSERIRGILEIAATSRSERDNQILLNDYIDHYAAETVREARSHLRQSQQAEKHFRDAIPTTLVMEEMEHPRTTCVLLRGQYDQPGEVVYPDVPLALSPWPEDASKNRLGFARWITADDNPLTARVAVNRLWRQCFGEGLVRTMNDFGTQGEPPTHPELLDWLAVTFRESGWDVKAMLRLIVTSRTYRQNSGFSPDGPAVFDPANKLLARGPSFRMSAEMIRDQVLAASGLLRRQTGGPSVKPWQPEGLWEEVSYNAEDSYVPDSGDGQWRRSLYTYMKRQAPPPSFLIFDGTTREKCTTQRARTNTPLQSLVLLNDPICLEASLALATTVLRREKEDSNRMISIFRSIISRGPDEAEKALLSGLLKRQRERLQQDPDRAKQLVEIGGSGRIEDIPVPELAAWTIVVHTIFNLDEAITRR